MQCRAMQCNAMQRNAMFNVQCTLPFTNPSSGGFLNLSRILTRQPFTCQVAVYLPGSLNPTGNLCPGNVKVWPRAVEKTDKQGKPFRNFSEIWNKFYSALWDKLLKFWEKLFRNLGEIQRFRNSENMRRKNLFRSEFFGTNQV